MADEAGVWQEAAERDQVGPLLERFLERLTRRMEVESCVLFGSRARCQADRHSDVDLVVVTREAMGKRPRDRSETVYECWPGSPALDAHVYTPSEVVRLDHLVLVDAVREGVVLLDRGTWAEATARLEGLISEHILSPRPWGWFVDQELLRRANSGLAAS